MPLVESGAERIYYVQQGERGLPILFIHGSAGNHLVWNSQVHALRDVARAIALDLPGHGKSGSEGRDSVPAYAEDIVALMDRLGLERAMIVGHSLGGAIAQMVALEHPARVAALGLVGTGARLRVLPSILQGVLEDPHGTAEFVTDNTYAPEVEPEMRWRAVEQFELCPPTVTYGDFNACNGFDVMARIGEIRVPTLIICGTKDRMTPCKYSEFLASKIPQSSLVLVPGAGHSVMVEKPEEVNAALRAFLTEKALI